MIDMRFLSTKERLEIQSIPITESGCWIWTGRVQNSGYANIRHNGKHMGAHRASYLAYKGDIPEGVMVCHACDTPLCVNPDHLFLGSHKDNMIDRNRKGRTASQRGERNGCAKLTESQVFEIKYSGMSAKEASAKFEISKSHAFSIKNGGKWSWV